MTTPSMEDYIELIYSLTKSKGYARVSDISEGLHVHPSSVTKMIQKLDKTEYVLYEKYRGFILTQKGEAYGKKLLDRHHLLEHFMSVIGVSQEKIYDDVEKLEHHLSWEAIDRIGELVEFFHDHPEIQNRLGNFQKNNTFEK